jgi:hypothetical protein
VDEHSRPVACLLSAATAAVSLAWRCTLPVAGCLVLLGLLSRGRDGAPPGPGAEGRGLVAVRDDGDTVRVALGVVPPDVCSALLVEDRDGRPFVPVHLYQDGPAPAPQRRRLIQTFPGRNFSTPWYSSAMSTRGPRIQKPNPGFRNRVRESHRGKANFYRPASLSNSGLLSTS